MALSWTTAAYRDLVRIHDFMAVVDPALAAKTVRSLVNRVRRIPAQPSLGQSLPEFLPREVRRPLVDDYEIRYELGESEIHILRVFHTSEDR